MFVQQLIPNLLALNLTCSMLIDFLVFCQGLQQFESLMALTNLAQMNDEVRLDGFCDLLWILFHLSKPLSALCLF